MNDLSDLVPLIAAHIGVAPTTLLLLIAIVHLLAKFGSRMIPNDATGFWGVLGRACAILGVDPSSRLTKGVSVVDVTTAALSTPPIPQKVAEAAESPKEGN